MGLISNGLQNTSNIRNNLTCTIAVDIVWKLKEYHCNCILEIFFLAGTAEKLQRVEVLKF